MPWTSLSSASVHRRGGLDAFHLFFNNMPADCGMAFVVILHLPADRKSMLTEILSRWTSMPVVEVKDRVAIEPGHVYVPPPHAIVTLDAGYLVAQMPASGADRVLRPIDAFFDSLGSAHRDQAVGIVLWGTGGDGALGLKAIKECGGLTIAQGSNGTAPEYGEMPAGAIATGAVDLIAPAEDMAGHLLRLNDRAKSESRPDQDGDIVDALRLEICEILRTRVGHDFSGYRSQTFMRRVDRRMHVVNTPTLQEYIVRLKLDRDEVVHLFTDLLIRVTSFFRDDTTFEVLAALAVPRLFEGKHADGTVRVWVPGCATGEEAYSLAILLRERLDTLQGAPKVQISAQPHPRSAVLHDEPGVVPEPSHLHGYRAAKPRNPAVSLLLDTRRHLVARQLRVGRPTPGSF
jgi:two-component system CheB/CheR fusion protein